MKKILRWSLVVVVILGLIFWFGARYILSFSQAEYSGVVHLKGIHGKVEVDFDKMGVPQIWAKDRADLYFALGWVHASERLFQMELIRRVTYGSLSEIFGKRALKFDIAQRRLGFGRKAEKEIKLLSKRELAWLRDYCDGINSWIENKSVLPPEFVLLDFKPRKWKPADVGAIMIYQTFFAHYLMDHDRQYQALMDKLGKDIFKYFSKFKSWSPSTVPFEKQKFAGIVSLAYNMSYASNSWVVSGGKSASGKPLHESDPHLQINSIPGFWYIVGLHSEDGINIVGVTTPSIPIVVMGHNNNCSFAFTVASVDLIDYYKEKLNPADSNSVLEKNGYVKIKTVEDSVKIKGESKAFPIVLQSTNLGVVVGRDSNSVTTLKWAGFDFNLSRIFRAGFGLQTVKNFSEFREFVTSLGALDVNWTYADRKGNIGYQLGAPVPIRDYANTYEKLPAEDSNYYWKGYVKLRETPFAFNPAQGFLASSNNQIVGANWKYKIPGFYDPYRIVRVNELLKSKHKFTVDDFKKFQQDLISVKAERWKNILAQGADLLGERKLAKEVIDWNGSMNKQSVPAGIFTAWWYYLIKEIFQDDLGKDWKLGRFLIEETLTDSIETLIDNKITPGKKESLAEISADALDSVLTKFGRPPLGAINLHILNHPLGVVKLLNLWLDLNRGPYPIGGDNSTIAADFNSFNPATKKFEAVVGPSMRFILDWSNVDSFLMIGNLGQSGNPFSRHYDDFLPFMQEGKYWNIPFTKVKIKERTVNKLFLMPLK